MYVSITFVFGDTPSPKFRNVHSDAELSPLSLTLLLELMFAVLDEPCLPSLAVRVGAE